MSPTLDFWIRFVIVLIFILIALAWKPRGGPPACV